MAAFDFANAARRGGRRRAGRPSRTPCARAARRRPRALGARLSIGVQLVLVRHALPERVHRDDGAATGPANPPLTELGRRQAGRLVRRGRGTTSRRVYTSPLAARRGHGRAAGLRPASQPAGPGRPARVRRRRGALRAGARDGPARSGGVAADAGRPAARTTSTPGPSRARVAAVLEGIVAAHPGRATAVVVAHAGVINIWLSRLLGIGPPAGVPAGLHGHHPRTGRSGRAPGGAHGERDRARRGPAGHDGRQRHLTHGRRARPTDQRRRSAVQGVDRRSR